MDLPIKETVVHIGPSSSSYHIYWYYSSDAKVDYRELSTKVPLSFPINIPNGGSLIKFNFLPISMYSLENASTIQQAPGIQLATGAKEGLMMDCPVDLMKNFPGRKIDEEKMRFSISIQHQ